MPAVGTLERRLGHRFRRKDLLVEALTHPSFENKVCYERLEFLGDLILDAIVGTRLFRKHADARENFLTDLKSAYVNRRFLHEVGEALHLGKHIRFRGTDLPRFDNFVEAVIGAVYLDGGWKKTEAVVLKWILSREATPLLDYKSILLTYARRSLGRGHVEYRTVRETGPAHRRVFEVKVRVPGFRRVGGAKALSRKEAQMLAARNLLDKCKEMDAKRAERARLRPGARAKRAS